MRSSRAGSASLGSVLAMLSFLLVPLPSLCPEVPNPDQSDCDGDGVGDVCDNDRCVDFCGVREVDTWEAGRSVWTGESSFFKFFYQYGSTPATIDVKTCARGAARTANGEPAPNTQTDEVQIRWCSCEGYGDDLELCSLLNCPQNNGGAWITHFSHSGWHLASYQEGGPHYVPPVTPPAGEKPYAYYPSMSCERYNGLSEDYWSAWDSDEAPTNYYTTHCTPRVHEYRNPATMDVVARTTTWAWPRELWWQENDALQGPTAQPSDNKDALREAGTWGFLWARPGGPVDNDDAADWLRANAYAVWEVEQ